MASQLTSRPSSPTRSSAAAPPSTSPTAARRGPRTSTGSSPPGRHGSAGSGALPTADDAIRSGTTSSPRADRPSDEEPARSDRRQTHLVLFGLSGQESRCVGLHVANRLHRPFVDTSSLADLRRGHTADVTAGASTVRLVLGRRNAVVLAAGRTALDTAVVPELADAVVIHIGGPGEHLGRHIADAQIDARGAAPDELVDRVIAAWEAAAD